MGDKFSDKPFFQMTPAERNAFAAELDKGPVPFSKTKPLSARGRALWEAARRGGRPPKPPGEKAVRVLFTIEPKLLGELDAYARAKGMSRAELLAVGARLAMGRAASMRQNPAPVGRKKKPAGGK